jgi:hypothetical protein
VAFAGKRQFMELLNLDASGQQLRGASKVCRLPQQHAAPCIASGSLSHACVHALTP